MKDAIKKLKDVFKKDEVDYRAIFTEQLSDEGTQTYLFNIHSAFSEAANAVGRMTSYSKSKPYDNATMGEIIANAEIQIERLKALQPELHEFVIRNKVLIIDSAISELQRKYNEEN